MPFALFDVLTLLNRGDDRGIGAGSPNSILFQIMNQERFVIAGWRLRKMLLGVNAMQAE